MLDLLEETRTVTTEPGDHDKFSHYCDKKDLEQAIFNGVPLTALCGKRWLPQGDFKHFPVCPECKEKYDSLPESPSN